MVEMVNETVYQRIDKFHAHLDICSQCRNHPFGLCATGAKLLKEAATGQGEDMSEVKDFMEKVRRLEKERARPFEMLKMLESTVKFEPRGPHPLAGRRAKHKSGELVDVEDWFDRVIGTPYLMTECDRPPFIIYLCRMLNHEVPWDNDVVCVKCHGSSGLVHNTEIEEAS